MTTNLLVDAVNTGLLKVLKDIANTYDNVEFDDLRERYLLKQNAKREKRKGHVSLYNIFVRDVRQSVVDELGNNDFKAVSAGIKKRWEAVRNDDKVKAELEQKRQAYLAEKEGGDCAEPVKAAPAAKAAPAVPKKGGAKRKKKTPKA